MNHIRRLKIHHKFRRRTWDNTTVPEIRLEGKWLEDAGFKKGAYVTIRVKQNRLTIIVDKTRMQ